MTTITHATVATGTDAGTGDIHKAQWNADHVITGLTGAGALVLLEQHPASSSPSLDFTNFISSDYDEYLIEAVNLVPATNGVNLLAQAGTGGGPTYDTGANYYVPGNTAAWLLATTVANNAGYGQAAFSVRLFDPQSTAQMKQLFGHAMWHNGSTVQIAQGAGGLWAITTAMTAIRFLFSSGNITSGTIRIYGVAKTANLSGGLNQSYVGYNAVGASLDTPGVNSKLYAKQITLTSDCFLASIGSYLSSASGTSFGPAVEVFSDNAGVPDKVIAHGSPVAAVLNMSSGARWVDVPIGVWLTAGTYWMAVRTTDSGASVVAKINYDTGGSDRTATSSAQGGVDWANLSSQAITSNQYSIRGSILASSSSSSSFALDSYLLTSGSTRNDEFTGGPSVDGKWTLVGTTPDTVNVNSDYAGMLQIRRNDTASQLSVYYQSLPSAPCTVVAKVRASTFNANFGRGGGIVILPATPTTASNGRYVGLVYNSGRQVSCISYTPISGTYGGETGATGIAPSVGVWLRVDILSGGTTFDAYFSTDGALWSQIASAVALGFTAANAGVALSPEGQAADMIGLFDFYRASA